MSMNKKSTLVLKHKTDVDRNIFWYLLRDYIAKKVTMEELLLDDIHCIRLGNIIFKSSAPVTLYHLKGDERRFDVDSIVFYCNFIHTPMYLTYMNKAIAAGKRVLRRGDVLDLKPFLLGNVETLPLVIDVTKTESPTPFILVDVTPEVEVQIDGEGGQKHYTLIHNIHPDLSITLSGSMYDKPCYLSFLKTWSQKHAILYCKRFRQFPVTELVRSKLHLPRNYYDILHAYVSVTGLPPTHFYGCGFGVTKAKALWAAALEIVRRMYHAGIINPKMLQLIAMNVGKTKQKKLCKMWSHQMALATNNLKKLHRCLEMGGVPNWLLMSNTEFEITRSDFDRTKGIVRKMSRIFFAAEHENNIRMRRRRKAVDMKELKTFLKEQNYYAKVIAAVVDQFEPVPECSTHYPVNRKKLRKMTGDGSDNDREDCSTVILNIFGSIDKSSGAMETASGSAVVTTCDSSSRKNKCYQYSNFSSNDNSEDNCDDDPAVISMPNSAPNSFESAATDPSTSADDDDCQIICVLKKEDKIALVTLDGSDDESLSASDKPGFSSQKPPPLALSKPNLNHACFVSSSTAPRIANKKVVNESFKSLKEREITRSKPTETSSKEWRLVRNQLGVTYTPSVTSVTLHITNRRKNYTEAFIRFDQEVWEYYMLNVQDEETFTLKMHVRRKLQNLIRQIYNKSYLVAIGSTVNGCGTYNSDMDLCLCVADVNDVYSSKRSFGSNALVGTHRQLMHHFGSFIKECNYIDAKVPILKLVLNEPYHELEVDISCNNTNGVYNSHLLHYYARIDERFPAICLVVKRWAIRMGVKDAYRGTLNSYTLELLVLHFLQCGISPPVLPNLQVVYPQMFSRQRRIEDLELFGRFPDALPSGETNQDTVGELLIAFFDYYAKFDFMNNAISIRHGTIFSRSDLPQDTGFYKIYVEDPYDGHNTASTVTNMYNFGKIQNAFIKSRDAFLGFCAGEPSLASIGVL